MTDKVLCPYCGAEMKISGWVSLINGNLAYTVCSNNRCKSAGPYVRGYETEAEARAAALSAAQARYLPPNRPLTLAEVKGLDMDDDYISIGWIEDRPGNNDWPLSFGRVRADCFSNCVVFWRDYGREYRVWLRKPTQAEMDAAGWGEESNENA